MTLWVLESKFQDHFYTPNTPQNPFRGILGSILDPIGHLAVFVLFCPKGLASFTQLVKVRRVTWFWHFRASDFHETFTRSYLALNMSKNFFRTHKDPPSSLQSPLSKIQTKPLYISTEGPATHFWDWAKPNIYTILYSTQMNYWWTYGEDQGVFVAMDE